MIERGTKTTDLLLKDEVYAIIGAAMEVHTILGHGFLENVYQEALEIELADRRIPFVTQSNLPIFYKERQLSKPYVADLLVYGRVIVELKAISRLDPSHDAQVINYLKASRSPLGVLINFGTPSLQWKRLVLTNPPKTLANSR